MLQRVIVDFVAGLVHLHHLRRSQRARFVESAGDDGETAFEIILLQRVKRIGVMTNAAVVELEHNDAETIGLRNGNARAQRQDHDDQSCHHFLPSNVAVTLMSAHEARSSRFSTRSLMKRGLVSGSQVLRETLPGCTPGSNIKMSAGS